MKDIAERADVTAVTVSRALSGKRGVSDEKRSEILELAHRLGYVHTKKGAEGKAKECSLCVMTMERYSRLMPSMYERMLCLLEKEAGRYGCCLKRRLLPGDGTGEDALSCARFSRETDGVIFLGDLTPPYRDFFCGGLGAPCVFIDSLVPPGQDCVFSDGSYGAYRLTNYLFDMGHARIVYVKTNLASGAIRGRYPGYERSVLEHGVSLPEVWTIDGCGSVEDSGKERIFRISHAVPDAYLCSSDLSAVMLFNSLKAAGIRCPEDVSVAGFDNFHHPDLPPEFLTMYEVDTRKMADKALRILTRRIRGDRIRRGVHIVGGRIVEGGSVRKRELSAPCISPGCGKQLLQGGNVLI